jgi:D-arabinose 1-dehydrogenase-like Zn-dependent alcohol dehydrogenase
MRYRSELVVLNPFRDQLVSLPLGNVIAKDLSIRAPCWADTKSIERSLDLFEKKKIKIAINKLAFDQAQVNSAWKQMESREKFEAPIVMMHHSN